MSTDAVPLFVPHFRVPTAVIHASQEFLRDRGRQHLEGTALWLGTPAEDGWVQITRVLVPEQIAETTEFGSYVELTQHAHYTLPDLLEPGELIYSRIHSHPGRAFHSATDNANKVITHRGAISIVVPNFARETLTLARCAIFYLEHGTGWQPFTSEQSKKHFLVEEGVR